MSDLTTMILCAALLPLCVAGLYLVTYIKRRQSLDILMLDGKALFEEIVKMVDGLRKWSPVFRNFMPRQSDEYLSFFHYIYVPYQRENPKKQKRRNDTGKTIKIGLLGAGALLLVLSGLSLLTWEITFLLLGLLMAWALGNAVLALCLVLKMDEDESRLLKEIDAKIIGLSGGAPPPPYWASLEDVLAQA